MAAKRISKSAIDWAAFAERVPANQLEFFKAFKIKSEHFVSKVYRFPENMPKIDFNQYRTLVSNKSLVDEFEKSYSAISVAFPKDTENLKATIDAEEKEALKKSQEYINELKESAAKAKRLMDKIDTIPKIEHLTFDMVYDYFPEKYPDPWKEPMFVPQYKAFQPGYVKPPPEDH